MSIDALRFTLPQFLSVIGLAQAVYVMVYMAFRAGNWRGAILPFGYFLVLALGFLADFAQDVFADFTNYDLLQWALWFAGPPLSVLLILQVARAGRWPNARECAVIGLVPLAFLLALPLALRGASCHFPLSCAPLRDWLTVTGVLADLVAMTILWPNRGLLQGSRNQKGGEERYWLILTLLVVNLFLLGFMLLVGLAEPGAPHVLMVRSVLGIALVYLAGTSLFRIYPQAVPIKSAAPKPVAPDEELAQRMRDLIELQKVYHEPAYSRSDLARELGIPEAAASRLVNGTYGRTFPQLVNERRVEDAKRLLRETDAAIKIIAEQVGFNSLASFNRVFRELAGQTPSEFRQSSQN